MSTTAPPLHDLEPIEVAHCEHCARSYWYPRRLCGPCNRTTVPRRAVLDGIVYSLTEVHRANVAQREAVPYLVALVRCDIGVSILTGCADVSIDDRVRVGLAPIPLFGIIPYSLKHPNNLEHRNETRPSEFPRDVAPPRDDKEGIE